MPRIALKLEYCGKDFCGSQYQHGVRTVQAELEKALSTLARAQVSAVFSGRTDSGVHAGGQVVHCDWPQENPDLWRLCWALNGIVPLDMSIAAVQIVADSFHARYTAVSRQYRYRLLNRPQRCALLRDTHHFIPYELNVEEMRAAALCLVGKHDFSSFKSTNSDRVSSVCRVSSAELLSLGEGVLEFSIAADHFVYNMVRIIVGTLIEIGLGKKRSQSLDQALNAKERNLAGPTAPPWGLCLESVQYPEVYELFAAGAFAEVNQENRTEI